MIERLRFAVCGQHAGPAAERVIEVAARRSPGGVDLLHTAVVFIDMQNDFAAPGGMFDRAWHRPRLADVQLV